MTRNDNTRRPARLEPPHSSTHLEREIWEQPKILADRRVPGAIAAGRAAAALTQADVTHAVIAARGSSDNAARYAQYLWGNHLGLATYLAAPSLYRTPPFPVLAGAVVIGISQSGQSPDIVRVLDSARRQHRPTIAITNDADSPLAYKSDVVVPLLAGIEKSLAATKTFTASLHAIVQIAEAAGATSLATDLDRLPDLLRLTLDKAREDSRAASALTTSSALTVIGLGTEYAAACEIALKIREITTLRAEAYPPADLLHGPIAGNTSGSAAWIIASPGQPADYWNDIINRLRNADVTVIGVSRVDQPLPTDIQVTLPAEASPATTATLSTALGQFTALKLGQQLHRDVDRPAGLLKITLTN